MTEAMALGLRWGIKASFVSYVARMPGGRAMVGDGATTIGSRELLYAPDPGVAGPADAELFLAFRGDVRFRGHSGFLDVRFANPWVTVTGGTAVLTVLNLDDPDHGPRARMVTFAIGHPSIEGDLAVWHCQDVRLADGATELFNDVYPAGEPFDPITIACQLTNELSGAILRWRGQSPA